MRDLGTEPIQRLLTDRHALLIEGLVRWLDVRRALEIGAWHGFVSVHIARAIKANGGGVLTIVDDFSLQNDCATLHNNLWRNEVADIVQVIAANSQQLQQVPPCEFAFIDGDHSEKGCAHDLNLAVAAGARCVVIHDTVDWWGPRDVVAQVRERFAAEWDVLEGYHDSGLAVLMRRQSKPEPAHTRERYPDGTIHSDTTKETE